jgi:UDP-glucuronate 4-epimerase
MRCLVTGAAGFIGSHLSQALLGDGHEVVGVDCMTPYYARSKKAANLQTVAAAGNFEFHETDLLDAPLDSLLDGVDIVFHQAGQPGVRSSWGSDFNQYTRNNIVVTQRLLESSAQAQIRRFVYASSSSVYGDSPRGPARETDACRPFSPYGVTKLAGENLCSAYADNGRLETVSLRYFTVYGPRQRPDMAFSKFIDMALDGVPLPLYAGGGNTRDFTYVDDVVRANLAAAVRPLTPGTVLNIAGGSCVSIKEVVSLLQEIVGVPIRIRRAPSEAGDVRSTAADSTAAREVLDWRPLVDLREGIASQVRWRTSIDISEPAAELV